MLLAMILLIVYGWFNFPPWGSPHYPNAHDRRCRFVVRHSNGHQVGKMSDATGGVLAGGNYPSPASTPPLRVHRYLLV